MGVLNGVSRNSFEYLREILKICCCLHDILSNLYECFDCRSFLLPNTILDSGYDIINSMMCVFFGNLCITMYIFQGYHGNVNPHRKSYRNGNSIFHMGNPVGMEIEIEKSFP